MFPEGLQVGDVLEAAVTVTRTDPVVGNHVEAKFGPLNFPAGQIDLSLQWPAGRTVALMNSPDLPQWQRGKTDGFETATMTLQDVKPIVPPSGAPARYRMVRMADASDYRSWNEVAAIEVPLYAKASVIPADGPLRAEVEKIRGASNDPVARAEAALQLVENRIRYVALEIGVGGLVPADSATTWARRFGDCKAKTALLLGILHELGIEAEPVTVNTGDGDALNSQLPAVYLFNHILVRATIAGKTYWLDGTRTGDTSLARLTVPDFRWGLPISKGVTGLVRMVPPPLQQPESDLAIDLDASKGIRGAVPAKIDLTLRGDDAIGTNQELAALAGSAREETLRKYWRSRFDFIEPQAFDAKFDQDTGELHLTMQGTATMDWKNGWYETDETSVGYRADFSRAAGAGHDAPFANAYPLYEHTRETILLPPDFTGNVSSDKTDIDETIAGIEYHRRATLTGNKFIVERSARSLVPEIPYKDAVTAQKRLRELADDAVYLRIPSGYRPTDGDLAVMAADTSKDDADGLLALGNAYMNSSKFSDALERFERVTDLKPKDAVAWADRGLAEAYLGKLTEATASLDKAASIEPQNEYMFHGRGIVADQRKAYVTAIAAYSKAIAIDPKDDFAYGRRAQDHFAAGQIDAALADAGKALELKPSFVAMNQLRAFAFMQLKKPSEAVAEIQRMVAANPDYPQLATMAKRMLSDFGMADKAKAIAGPAADTAPTAQTLYSKALLREAKDTAGQLSDLTAALKLNPDFVPALAARAALLSSHGQYDAALADAERAISRDPKNVNVYLLKANLLRKLGRRDDAIAVAKAVIGANSQIPLAFVIAGKIYQAFNLHDDAVAAIDKAIALALEPYMYLNRADIRPFDATDARLADVEAALKMDANFPPALAMKAQLLSRKGDHAGAAKIYDAIIAKEPQQENYLDARGIELWRVGQRDAAEKDFAAADSHAIDAMQFNNLCYEKATADVALEIALKECNKSLQLSPDSAPILDSRATVYLQMGRYKEAKADYDSALARYPTMAPSLLGRAVARYHLGDIAGAKADLAAARKQESDIVDRFRFLGIAVPQGLTT
jgi:tetratricopeptide (TPR) repeat protein